MTPDLVAAALRSIPSDVSHDERVRLAFAVHDGIGDAGEELWLEWAAGRSKPNRREDMATWKSARKPGPTKVGTLFHVAGQHGFRFPEDAVQTPAPDAAAAAELRQAVEAKRNAEATKYRVQADRVAAACQAAWAAASGAERHPYLERKGVAAHGLRLEAGVLLVPLRDAEGLLQNVQRISADGEKRFAAGGRKTGLFHWCGDSTGQAVLLMAEGYATAATLHEATGLPVAVAFDAGNLVHVARTIRELQPAAALLICGDDDHETEQSGKGNAGRKGAMAAARAGNAPGAPAGATFPAGLVAGASDFNDLASAQGLDVVAEQVRAAIAALQAGELEPKRRSTARAADAAEATEAGEAPADERPAKRDNFEVDDRAVWWLKRTDGDITSRVAICGALRVLARTHAEDGNGWGYLLEFRDPDGTLKTRPMPAALFGGTEWAGALRDMGLCIEPWQKAQLLLGEYIQSRNPSDRVIVTDRVGWHGDGVYVLPTRSIGGTGSRAYAFQSEAAIENTYFHKGTLEEWQEHVAAPCVGNSRAMFVLSCAFAGVLLKPAGQESGGINFRAGSSSGKTSFLKLGASVWGRPSFMQRWRTTDNALESTAVQHSDNLLILDELSQVDARLVGEIAYMLGNGQEKGRANRNGLARKKRTWQLLYLSAGEVSLADHLGEAGKRPRAGQEMRMLDIPFDAGAGMGGVEQLHGHASARSFAAAMVSSAAQYYGTAGVAWLDWATKNYDLLGKLVRGSIELQMLDMGLKDAGEQVSRAAMRFALIGTAGELATRAGITGWAAGEAAKAAKRCFQDWVAARGHDGNAEPVEMIRQVKRVLSEHGDARFTWANRGVDDHAPKTMYRLGFRRLLDEDGRIVRTNSDHQAAFGDRMSAEDGLLARTEFLVLPELFKSEICKGHDPAAVARELAKRGYLSHDKDRLTSKQRLPGFGKAGVAIYLIKPSIWEGEE